jgi:transcriptional regulator
MYVPDHFAEDDPERIAEIIDGYGFALVVTVDGEGLPFASHLPLMHEPGRGPRGTIVGHMARDNPQWRHFERERDVLAVFSGPHAYVSPSWYDTHPAVPTWNYAAVHVYGRPRIIEDIDAKKAAMKRLVDRHEAARETPWKMDLPPSYETGMLRAIVAFEIEISRIEGKFKLSQNRDDADRRHVADRLGALGYDDAMAVAALMHERYGP